MQSALYEADHEAFRAMLRDFLAKEVLPHHAAWEAAGVVDRSVWLRAGEQGLLGMDVPEEYGEAGSRTSATTRSSPPRSAGSGPAGWASRCRTTSSRRT
ncbi:acyl-CoA dehydrogenase family protein [Blastococcus brunescens]|uniref:Acyl-CoA dehydrogenase family protein n=1 Tax=Blastococcus brunescens TaxID=1564165 RepID=A0ABZ1B374_9ACTN|nr:acyl-CoA dehydrogenase family protein [Blastococcus sp. BMG 8361]WRL65262.1 acyl-CoA dehydrogenase family protein [Blastococcus sp. BMG 8361]